MKYFTLLLSFTLFLGLNLQAQECPYSKKSHAKVERSQSTSTAAAKAASLDDSIEKRTCPQSGKVSYLRKSVCEKSGKVSLTEVEYCSKSEKFINVSPRKAGCTKSKAAGACGAKATKVSGKASSCCSSAQKAACAKKCKANKAKTKTVPSSGAKVKLVKSEK